jgi:hypothetical protein
MVPASPPPANDKPYAISDKRRPQGGRRRWRNALITLGVLLPVMGYVVYSSFQVGDVECEVCITFEGRDACRTVAGKTEADSTRGAVTNTCAQLASGVTDTLRCERTVPRKAECRRARGG